MNCLSFLKKKEIHFIGLPKTGSPSLAGVLSLNNNSAPHEFMFEETIKSIYNFKNKTLSLHEFYAFLNNRRKHRPSTYDISTYNYHYLDFLKKNNKAKFIFSIRDEYTWSNSLLNHINFHFNTYGIQEWHNVLCKLFFGEKYNAIDFVNSSTIIDNLNDLVPKLLIYWSNGLNVVMNNLPNKLLVLNTTQRIRNIEMIKTFLDLDQLNLEDWNLNQARNKIDYLGIDKNLSSKLIEEICIDSKKLLNKIGIEDLNSFNSFIYSKK